MQKRKHVLRCLWVVILAGTICYSQLAKAGWNGLINGAGYGNSWSSVSHSGTTKYAQTPGNVYYPSDTVPPASTYTYVNTSPTGASVYTYQRSKGLAGGIWQNTLFCSTGDGTDNLELQARVNIVPVTCAALTMDSSIDTNAFNANGHSGTITVNAHATGGTALWLRGFEYTGDPNLIPPDDPTTVTNESIEFLKLHGVWKFETLLVGPFDFGDGSCPLIIPFTLDSGDLNNLYFGSSGAGLTVPFSIQCPPDVNAGCGQAVNYPPVQVSGGCGSSTISFSPPQGSVFPLGTTPVTATATDQSGNTVSCGFNVVVTGVSFQGFYSPIGGVGGTCTSPLVTVNQGSVLPIKFDIFCGNTLITGGTPPFVTIQQYVNCQPFGGIISGPAVYQNNWHFNWDTSVGVVNKGIYKIIVTMPDKSTQIAFVRIK